MATESRRRPRRSRAAAGPDPAARDDRLKVLSWHGESLLRKPGCAGAVDRPLVDRPVPRESVLVGGWALFLDGTVSHIDVLIDGEPVGRARIGLPRPDVASKPDLGANPAAAVCGFTWEADPESLPADRDTVTVEARVTGTDGDTFELRLPMPLTLEPTPASFDDGEGHAARLRDKTEAVIRRRTPRERDGLRLLAFTHRLDHGGAQRYFFEQVRHLMRDAKVSCTVVSPEDGVWRERFERIGADVLITPYASSSVVHYETAAGQLATWADAHAFDVAYANTLDAFIGVDVASRLGLPVAWAIHESFHLSNWWQAALAHSGHPYARDRLEHALGEASALIFAAEATQRLFEPYADPERMITAPYGLELDDIDRYRGRFVAERASPRRTGIPDDAVLLLCLGTVIGRKAQAVLAQAFAQVAEKHPKAHVVMVGDTGGDYSDCTKAYIAGAGLGSRCSVLPVTSDPYAWHEVADVFVLASDIESSPISILEAMAFETPVIASRVFGVPELIEDGRNGFLCEPNDVGDLAAALDRVLRLEPAERHRAGVAGAERVRTRHDPERYAEALRGLLSELADDPTAVPRWRTKPVGAREMPSVASANGRQAGAPERSPNGARAVVSEPALIHAEPEALLPESEPLPPGESGEGSFSIRRTADTLDSPAGPALEGPAFVIDHVADTREQDGAVRPLEASLDCPVAGTGRHSYALELSGWAFDPSSPTTAVEVCIGERSWRRIQATQDRPDLVEAFPDQPHAASCGFSEVVGLTSLPQQFELTLRVVLADGVRLPTWRVLGHRKPLSPRPSRPPRLRPVALNALGRTGSTWLTRLLDQHPEVLVYRPFEYEPRIAGYWLEVLRNLSEPRSFLGALSPYFDGPRWWLGDFAVPRLPPAEDEVFENSLGREAVEELASFCRRRAEAAYMALARQRGKPSASLFVEKTVSYVDAWKSLHYLRDEVYPDSAEVVLIRDPRDVVCSMLAYDERRGVVGFGRQDAASERDFLKRLRAAHRANLDRHRSLGERSLIVRYEDLMERPHDILAQLFEHLSIDASGDTVRDVVEQARIDTPGMQFHRTADNDSGSVGRWRRDMSTGLRELVDEVFAEELADGGYLETPSKVGHGST